MEKINENMKEAGDILPIANRYNIYNGEMPHVPIAVEHIAEYFTVDDWKNCVPTIRTIGTIRRLENEFYEIESLDKRANIRVPLSRGTNRELKVSWDSSWLCSAKNRKKEKKINDRVKMGNEVEKTVISFPESSSTKDPNNLGDNRVKDGRVYIVLGKLQWSNNRLIINVDRFIPVQNIEKTYETFRLQYMVTRRHVDQFKANFEEVREVVRKPEEKRKPRPARKKY